MFVTFNKMTEEDKQKLSEMSGNILRWVAEGRSIWYMSDKLNLPPWQIERNVDEMMYILRCQAGKWRFFKTLFIK